MLFPCTKDQALALVHCHEADLFSAASVLRTKHFGSHVQLCSIINARSGHCNMNCTFCSQSKHHKTEIPTFELLSPSEILQRLHILSNYPINRVGIVTSGGTLNNNDLQSITKTLKHLPPHWQGRLCTSLGKLSTTSLQTLKEAGLTRYHHNLESSTNYYPQICTTQKWQERFAVVQRVQKLHMQICTGGIFGVGESWEDRIDFAIFLRENNINHIPINFLYPHKNTPLAMQKPLEAAEALRIIAIFRHILPTATLRICGGRPLVLGQRQADMFAAGANALMTGDYLTTKGKSIEDDCRMIEKQGLLIAK